MTKIKLQTDPAFGVFVRMVFLCKTEIRLAHLRFIMSATRICIILLSECSILNIMQQKKNHINLINHSAKHILVTYAR